MIPISPTLAIDENDIVEEFVRASGPGGQNVNKVATAVQLRYDVANSAYLPDPVKERLRTLAGRRLTDEGVLVIVAQSHRSQSQNRQAAQAQLIDLLRRATHVPRRRIKTKPSRAARQRRLDQKRQRSRIKDQRRTQVNRDE